MSTQLRRRLSSRLASPPEVDCVLAEVEPGERRAVRRARPGRRGDRQ